MTNQEILTKAIEKATANGYKSMLWVSTKEQEEAELIDISQNRILWEVHGRTKQVENANDLIFNHDFAKALWGDSYPAGDRVEAYKPEEFNVIPFWQYHLQQMVIAEDPIKYLGDNI